MHAFFARHFLSFDRQYTTMASITFCLFSMVVILMMATARAFVGVIPIVPTSATTTSTTCQWSTASTQSTTRREDNNNNSEPTTSFTDEPLQLNDPVILFDGVCNFCNTWVDILLRLDTKQTFKFAPLQGDLGQRLLIQVGKEADDISSVMLIQPDGTSFAKSNCVLRVVEELGWVGSIFSQTVATLVPLSLRNTVYDTVAENRYQILGKRDQCRCSDPEFAHRFLS